MSRFLMHVILACLCFIGAGGSAEAAAVPSYERLQPVMENMTSPTAVALDKHECLIVAESIGNRVLIYSQSGHYMGQITGLARPISVAVDDNIRIYIGNKDRGNVVVYDSELNFLFKLGSGDGEFGQPNDIAIDSNGYVYVVDSKKNSVRIYNSDGTLYSSFGSTGNGAGQFYGPSSIAIDEMAGELIVLDHSLVTDMFGSQVEGARVQVFTMNGQFKRSFAPYGNEIGQLFRPQHLFVDSQRRVYITDTFHNVVLIYDSNGNYLGDLYDQVNPLRIPMGITIGGSNRIFIASLLSGKVELYGIDSYTQMVVSPLDINFEASGEGASPAAQSVEILNSGTGVLSWTAVTEESWINLSDTSGITQPEGASTIDIGVILNGLAPGSYAGSVSISASTGATERVSVVLEVLPTPDLSVMPASLTFTSTNGAAPAGQALMIENSGAGAMNWTAATDSSWILMNRDAGSAPDTLGVAVDVTALSAGTYNGTITITGEGALSSPADIPVTLNILEVTGEIQVTANIEGASFMINGPQSYSGSGASWSRTLAPSGVYSIVFGDVEGYAKPSSSSKTLQPQGTIIFHGEYVPEEVSHSADLEDLLIDFGAGSGIWVRYDNASWAKLHEKTALHMVSGNIDGTGKDDVIIDFGEGIGIWGRYNNSSWMQMHKASSEALVAGDIDGSGDDDVIIDFGPGSGIWVRYNNTSWKRMHASSPETMVTGDIDGSGRDDVIIDFGPGVGVWVRYDDTTWKQLHGSSPDSMVTGDIDGSGRDDVIIDFGPGVGVWVRYNDTTWKKLHGSSPGTMAAADIDGSGHDDVIADFGSGKGIWVHYNNASWTNLHQGSCELISAGKIN